MNKQEAIEYIENGDTLTIEDKRNDSLIDMVIKSDVLAIISQIDEPKKVVIPKFVAEWIERTKSVGWSFKCALNNSIDSVCEWLANRNNQETFARAWLDGFEIEQEKLYTVEIPDPHSEYRVTFLAKNSRGEVRTDKTNNQDIFISKMTHLTEAEIKQDFEWAWNAGFAKEVE